jgi:23S rRNA pseudouridine2605 synthase
MCADKRRSRQEQNPVGERLQKVLAQAGVASRRTCEEYILQGRVSVNGEVVRELGTRVRPDVDRIELDGNPVDVTPQLYYYLMYKPTGYLSTTGDPHGGPNVLELVPERGRLYPVGRLDLESEGLLLLTNDGALTERLTHPRYEHEKEYMVLVRGLLTTEEIERLKKGVMLRDEEDEEEHLARARVMPMPPGWSWRGEPTPRATHWMRFVLKEGRKRQIRRMLEAINHRVARLIRVRMGILRLGELEPGKGHWLSKSESGALRRSVGLDGGPGAAPRPTRRQVASRQSGSRQSGSRQSGGRPSSGGRAGAPPRGRSGAGRQERGTEGSREEQPEGGRARRPRRGAPERPEREGDDRPPRRPESRHGERSEGGRAQDTPPRPKRRPASADIGKRRKPTNPARRKARS